MSFVEFAGAAAGLEGLVIAALLWYVGQLRGEIAALVSAGSVAGEVARVGAAQVAAAESALDQRLAEEAARDRKTEAGIVDPATAVAALRELHERGTGGGPPPAVPPTPGPRPVPGS